ncbi:MAG: kynureninase [Caulobacterales bacterium]|nr:kynureninase [Caulobacterales bacterium]
MDRAHALALDAADPLARFRERFELPEGLIYLDGNSLGALPKTTAPALEDLVRREWGRDLITSWNKAGWIDAPARIGGKIARLVGAAAHEVAVADSTSVNLYKLAAGALSLRPGRRKIVTERGNFHTDVYILEGLAALTGAVLEVVPTEAVLDAIDETTALVVLTHVHYASARMWDMAAVTAAAHARGALMLWDLSHTAGALACDLTGAGADLAVGCGYKHLNGGPGAPAFLYVAERHQAAIRSPLQGWMGHAEPFAFEPSFRPAPDLRAQLCGTPPILGMAALECGVDVLLEADRAEAQAKGRALCAQFIALVESRCAAHGLRLLGPRPMDQRGLHVSFAHPEAYAVVQALIARGVIGDFRAPDIARFGFPPLYLRHVDVWDAVEILRQVLDERAWDRPEFKARAAVT